MTVVNVELHIERLSKLGEGVARHEGRSVFVEGALPGEQVLAVVTETSKVLRGEIAEILKPSSSRRTAMCPLQTQCGGCDWMFFDEETQLQHKQEIVRSTLAHVGEISSDAYALLPPVSASPMGYRRRAVFHPVSGSLGFHGRKTHQRIVVPRCPALTDPLSELPARLAAHFKPTTVKELEEVRVLECEARVAVSLHFKDQIRPRHRELASFAVSSGLIDGAILQPGEGRGQTEFFGEPILEENGLFHRPDGFAQANAEVNRRLIQHAAEMLDIHRHHRILELYSGNGNFTLRLAELASHVLAVESSSISVALAQRAVRKAGVTNVRLAEGDSAKVTAGLMAGGERFDRLLVDPPRAGAPGVGAWAARLLVERLVYVSCDPASLARDAKEIIASGYQPTAVQLFDLFPQTHHIEVLMTFNR